MDEHELSVFFEPWLRPDSWMSDHDFDDDRFHGALLEAVKAGHSNIDNGVHEEAFLIAIERLEKREPSKAERDRAHDYGIRASSIMQFLRDTEMLDLKS